jgi:uncharacterized membrane protein
MIIILPIFALLAYVAYMCLCYCEYFKSRPFEAYLVGILASIVSTISWLYLIRNYTENKNNILYINLCWDVCASILYIIIPIMFFDVKLDLKVSIGCVLTVLGLVIIKI